MADKQLETKIIPLSMIEEHPENYNRHPEEQVTKLAKSLKTFGYIKLIVVQPPAADGDPYRALAGNGILAAARLLGINALECTVAPADWTPAQAAAYMVADNKLAAGSTPDLDKLQTLARTVSDASPQYATAAGLDRERLSRIRQLADSGEGAGDPEIRRQDPEFYHPTFEIVLDKPAAAVYRTLLDAAPGSSEPEKLTAIIRAVNPAAL